MDERTMLKRPNLNKLSQECECGEVITGSAESQMKHNMKMHTAGDSHKTRMRQRKTLEQNKEHKDGKTNK